MFNENTKNGLKVKALVITDLLTSIPFRLAIIPIASIKEHRPIVKCLKMNGEGLLGDVKILYSKLDETVDKYNKEKINFYEKYAK